MIGGGAIALGIGVLGYSFGSTLTLFYAMLLIPFNWCVLVLDENEQQSVVKFLSTRRRFVLSP